MRKEKSAEKRNQEKRETRREEKPGGKIHQE